VIITFWARGCALCVDDACGVAVCACRMSKAKGGQREIPRGVKSQ